LISVYFKIENIKSALIC